MKKKPESGACRVDGCGVVLAEEGARHVRVKTCREHQLADEVLVDVCPHRFCQQCMRLHSLDRFDGQRRSCRNRLQRQNKRRKHQGAVKKAIRMAAKFEETRDPVGFMISEQSSSSGHAQSDSSTGMHHARTGQGSPAVSLSDCSATGQENISAENISVLNSSAFDIGNSAFDCSFFSSPLDSFQPGALQQLPPAQPDNSLNHICVGLGCTFCRETKQAWNRSDNTYEDWFTGEIRSCSEMPFQGWGNDTAMATRQAKQPPSFYDWDGATGSSSHVLNFSMKMHSATPNCLPDFLHDQLTDMLMIPPLEVEGSIRPGCVHLSVDFWMRSSDEFQAALRALKEALPLSCADGVSPWSTHKTDMRLPDCTIQVQNGNIVRLGSLADSIRIKDMDPFAAVAAEGDKVVLIVEGLKRSAPFKVLMRHHGFFHEPEIEDVFWTNDSTAVVTVAPPSADGPPAEKTGFAWVEVIQDEGENSRMSEALPILLTDDEDIAAEVCQYKPEHLTSAVIPQLTWMAKALGTVLCPPPEMEAPIQAHAMIANKTASLGWCSTLEAIVECAMQIGSLGEFLAFTDDQGAGTLLASAVISRSIDTIATVLSLMSESEQRLQLAAVTPTSAKGLTVMHWAALQGDPAVIHLLLSSLPGAWEAWMQHRAGPDALTPDQMLRQRGVLLTRPAAPPSMSEGAISDQSMSIVSGAMTSDLEDTSSSNATSGHSQERQNSERGEVDGPALAPLPAASVLGRSLVNISCSLAAIFLLLPSVMAIFHYAGFQADGATALVAMVTMFLIHVAFPIVQQRCYVKPLAALQQLCGARRIGPLLNFVDSEIQRAYVSFSLGQGMLFTWDMRLGLLLLAPSWHFSETCFTTTRGWILNCIYYGIAYSCLTFQHRMCKDVHQWSLWTQRAWSWMGTIVAALVSVFPLLWDLATSSTITVPFLFRTSTFPSYLVANFFLTAVSGVSQAAWHPAPIKDLFAIRSLYVITYVALYAFYTSEAFKQYGTSPAVPVAQCIANVAVGEFAYYGFTVTREIWLLRRFVQHRSKAQHKTE